MLSIGRPKTPHSAQEYLLQDDPYFRDRNASWFGKAAEALGLAGKVNDEAFASLLAGSDPEGKRLVRAGGPSHTRIAGFDLTFSAPKSCSLVSLRDGRVVNAHSGAVETALAFAEDRYAQARAMSGGKQVELSTGNIATALFVHMTSRALDPQLHTHAFVLNITRRPEDGQWRALHRGKQITTGKGATAVVSNPFYAHHLLLGQVYRNELARDLAVSGYGIRVTDPGNGFWELGGIPDPLIEGFSKRRTEIEQQAQDYQRTHPNTLSQKLYDRATVHTRLWKVHTVTREALLDMWTATAEHLGTPLDTLPRLALSPEKAAGEQAIRGDGVDSAEQLLAKAVSIFAATGQKPSREQVLLAALKLGIGFYGIDSFRASAEKLPFSWELDRTARDVHDRPHPHGAKNGRQLQLEI